MALTAEQKALLEEANKLAAKNKTGNVTEAELLANPNMNAQQLANKHVTDYWSRESEAFSRVNAGMNNGTAKLIKNIGYDENGNPFPTFAITTGEHPGYDTLNLSPTDTPNVYSFTTSNQKAGGHISGIIGANFETGKYAPITNAAIQTGYTPGSPGGWIKNTLNDIGPLGNIALAIATGGMSIPAQLAAQAALNMAKGQDFEDALINAGVAVGGSQLVQGITSVDPVSGMDLAADAVAGNSLADVGAALGKDAGIAALAPELNIGTAAPPVTDVATSPVTSGAVTETTLPPATGGIEALTPELNVGTAAPPAPTGGIEALTPELNVGTAAPPAPDTGIAALTPDQTTALNNVTIDGTSGFAPTEPVSGMDMAGDATAGNTITEAGQGIAALPAEPVSGMDMAADATKGNTIAEAGSGIAGLPTTTATLNPASIESLTGQAGYGVNAAATQAAADLGADAAIVGAGAGVGAASVPILNQIAHATGIPESLLTTAATSLGIKLGADALGLTEPNTVTNAHGSYTGPLANIQYNPATYTPYTYKPYAGGGAVEGMSNANAIGANTGFPMADIQRGAYSTPYQQPISQNVVTGAQDTRVDPYTGAEMFASGGIANLGGYSDGGRLLRGPGDGVSDSIPAMIGNRQPARLADGEFVIPARIVSEIGNGSTDAGARKLYEMMDRVQAARRKTTGKGKFAANTKADKYLPT